VDWVDWVEVVVAEGGGRGPLVEMDDCVDCELWTSVVVTWEVCTEVITCDVLRCVVVEVVDACAVVVTWGPDPGLTVRTIKTRMRTIPKIISDGIKDLLLIALSRG
jgi:hypothetical protein